MTHVPSHTFICGSLKDVELHSVKWQDGLANWKTCQFDGAEPFLSSRQLLSYSWISKHFKEPEGSLPRSQEPSTGPYPEPVQSSPCHYILFLQDQF
jgi:hypothetical protein